MENAFRLGMLLDFIAMFAILEYYMGWEIVAVFVLALVTSYSEYSRANSYPWSPFSPRLARPGPGPRTSAGPSLFGSANSLPGSCFQAKVDAFVPHTQRVNIRVVCEPQGDRRCLRSGSGQVPSYGGPRGVQVSYVRGAPTSSHQSDPQSKS